MHWCNSAPEPVLKQALYTDERRKKYRAVHDLPQRGMIMALFDTTAFRITEQGLNVMWSKMQVIEQNLVNENTPKYNCKYLEFSGILRDKLRANGSVKKELSLAQRIITDYTTNDEADRNNVDHDTQAADLAKTQIQFNALIEQMNGSFARIRSAIVTK